MTGWPAEDTAARRRLDHLYWGDPPRNAAPSEGEPGADLLLLRTEVGPRSLVGLGRPHGLAPVVFACHWACLRTVLGGNRLERRRTFRTVPAAELDPLIKACAMAFLWAAPGKRKAPPS